MKRIFLLGCLMTATLAAACTGASAHDASEEEGLTGDCPHRIVMKHGGGGTVLTDVSLVNVYWGAWWTTSEGRTRRQAIDLAWKTLGNDARFYRPLQEDAPGGAVIQGRFLGSATENAALTSGDALTDDTLEGELAREIASGALPAATAPSVPFYYVYLAPDVSGPVRQGPAYAAYHHALTLPGSGTKVAYGLALYAYDPDLVTIAESHELYEAMTNPFDDGLRDVVKDDAGAHMEIADLCEDEPSSELDGHAITKIWSNRACGCVDPQTAE